MVIENISMLELKGETVGDIYCCSGSSTTVTGKATVTGKIVVKAGVRFCGLSFPEDVSTIKVSAGSVFATEGETLFEIKKGDSAVLTKGSFEVWDSVAYVREKAELDHVVVNRKGHLVVYSGANIKRILVQEGGYVSLIGGRIESLWVVKGGSAKISHGANIGTVQNYGTAVTED